MYIRDELCLVLGPGRSADTLSALDVDAGGFSLERSENELIAADYIKSCPVDVGERFP